MASATICRLHVCLIEVSNVAYWMLDDDGHRQLDGVNGHGRGGSTG